MEATKDLLVICHRVALPRWNLGPLKIVLISDSHACWPFVSLARLRRIVGQVNALAPDLILHGGDFIVPRRPFWRAASPEEAVAPFAELSAPLGVFAVLGNHDYTDDPTRGAKRGKTPTVVHALADTGVTLLRNTGRIIPFGDAGFFLGRCRALPIAGRAIFTAGGPLRRRSCHRGLSTGAAAGAKRS